MSDPEGNFVCSVCLTALDFDAVSQEWIHSLANEAYTSGVTGHEPRPVPLANVHEHRLRCDFCFAPHPTWTVPCDDFDSSTGDAGSLGPWAACDTCHLLIEANDCKKLVHRVLRESPSWSDYRGEARTVARALLTETYTRFMKARTGGDYRGMVRS